MAGTYRLSAKEVVQSIQLGHLSVEEYARSLLDHIRDRNDSVKAWVHLDPDYIIAQAKKLDQIPLDRRGPLHGIAVGIKDVIVTEDMPTRFNSKIYQHLTKGTLDAASVIILRSAGALIFGKTATTEFAATTAGTSCGNPHNLKHTPGGSSSGSGAAVADHQVTIALGTQTGGSIIRPGSYNGVYAFKPTWGTISTEGMARAAITLDTIGFFARQVDDLELLTNVYRIIDDNKIFPFKIQGARIAFVKTHVWPKAGPGLISAWEKAKSILNRHGANVEDIDLPNGFEKLSKWQKNIMLGEFRASFLGNYLFSKDKLHEYLVGEVERSDSLPRKVLLESQDEAARLRPIWDEFANQYDAIITPSVPDEAPYGLESTGDSSFCVCWTLLRAPVLNVPGFEGSNGLPIGLSIVGPRYCDQKVLNVGKVIGELFMTEGGFKSDL